MDTLPTKAIALAGPFSIVGRTIVGAPQPKLDEHGNPIAGKFIRKSLAEILPHEGDAVTMELFRSSFELVGQRDDLAKHLRSAVNYIEHGIGDRNAIVSTFALRNMLDKDVREGLKYTQSFGLGDQRSTAEFDLGAARMALEQVAPAPLTNVTSYAELRSLVEQMAQAMDKANLSADASADPATSALIAKAYEALSGARPSSHLASETVVDDELEDEISSPRP